MTIAEAVGATGTRTDRPAPGTWVGGRFRLDERISTAGGAGTRIAADGSWSRIAAGGSWSRITADGSWSRITAGGISVWKATDGLLCRPVTVHLLPGGVPVPPRVVEAVRSAARVNDARLAAIYDTDFAAGRPYIVSEWAPGTHLEDLVLSGLPYPALAAAMIADAADALAVAHRARRPHLRLTPRSLRWDPGCGLKITGLGLDAALCGSTEQAARGAGAENPVAADTIALGRMLYALLTGYWPGEEATALRPAPRFKGRVCTPRQVRAGVPAHLDAITHRALQGQAPDAPLRPQTPAGLAMALRRVQRPSYQLDRDETAVPMGGPAAPRRHPRHARAGTGLGHRITLLRPAV